MVNAFSFCLYGPANPRYYPGMLENVYLAGKYFPTWKVYIYHGPDVTESILNHLGACTNVVLIPTGITGAKNMIHRFFAIDEPEVDLMMVRDADSRIHWKDRWAIHEFVASPCIAHTIRDNPEHTARIMGGLWGLKKSSGIHMQTEYANYVEDTSLGHRVSHDQNFLGDVIYPKVLPRLLVHHIDGMRFVGERHAVKFPFVWTNDVYCGRVESATYIDTPQPPPVKLMGLFPTISIQISDRISQPLPPTSAPPPVFIRDDVQPLKFLHKK